MLINSLFFSVLVFSISSGLSLKERIYGTWEVVDFEAQVNEASEALIAAGKQESLSSVYVFKEDGTFRLTSDYLKEGREGTFKIYEGLRVLRLSYNDGNQSYFDILSLENGMMKLKVTIGDLGYTIETLKRR